MSDLTEVNGLKLESEFADNEIYQRVRSIQFLLLHTYKLGNDLKITETKLRHGYFYTITNQSEQLNGFVGRDVRTGQIEYMVKDWSQIKRMLLEGFELTEENYALNRVIVKCKTINDFILFVAKQKGYKFMPI
jgi:hypothetical protein